MTRHKRVISCRASAPWLRSRQGACLGRRGTAGSLARLGEPALRPGRPRPRPGPWLLMSRAPGSGYHVPVRTEQLPPPEAAAARGGGLRSPSPAVRSGAASAAGTRLRSPAGTVRDTWSSTPGGRHRANSAPNAEYGRKVGWLVSLAQAARSAAYACFPRCRAIDLTGPRPRCWVLPGSRCVERSSKLLAGSWLISPDLHLPRLSMLEAGVWVSSAGQPCGCPDLHAGGLTWQSRRSFCAR